MRRPVKGVNQLINQIWQRRSSWRLPAILGLLSLFCTLAIAACAQPNTIVIGSKDFTEQIILSEILAQQIESQTDLSVDRRFNLGGTLLCHQALTAGQIDLYVEYTGTALANILKRKPSYSPKQVYQQVKQEYAQKFKLDWTEPLGFNNTFAIIVRGQDAERLKLETISQAARYTPQWQAGVGYEFIDRPDGYSGLTKTYGLKFAKPPKVMDLGLMYRALNTKQVDLVAGNFTDGVIASLNLKILEDDKRYFPPYEAAPIVRQQTLAQYPELRQVLQQLGGQISEAEMRRLNYQVDGERRDVKQVVQEFLQSQR